MSLCRAFGRFQQSTFFDKWSEFERTEAEAAALKDGTSSADLSLPDVLIVDASVAVVKIISRALLSQGYAAVQAASMEEADNKMKVRAVLCCCCYVKLCV
jgi:hypothetical protein